MPKLALFDLNNTLARNSGARRTAVKWLGLGLSFGLFYGCSQQVWPDREPTQVDGIRIDSLKFQSPAKGFVFSDSSTRVLFKGYHTGYLPRPGHTCSEFLDLGIEAAKDRNPTAFRPHSKIRLPADPDCPLDRIGRDTTLTHIFKLGTDSMVRLLNSAGSLTDSAKLIKGRISKDSLKGIPAGSAKTIILGRWIYLDSNATQKRRVRADSLNTCQYLTSATYAKLADSVKIRLTLVIRDSTSVADTCHGIKAAVELIPELTRW